MLLPLKDNNPTRRFPYVTVALIVANVLVFIWQQFTIFDGGVPLTVRLAMVPYELTHMVDEFPRSAIPIPLTPFTSMFLHAGLWHLGGNMLYLWIFGNNVEDELGRVRFTVFYFLSGLVAAGAHILTAPDSTVPVIGASGAVAGVLGAYAVIFPRARVLVVVFLLFFIRLFWLPAVFVLGFWFVLQVIYGLPSLGMAEGGGTAWFAHIGGFLMGMLWAAVLVKRRGRPTWYDIRDRYWE